MKKITFTLLASIAMLFVSCDENDDADTLKKVGVAAKISSPDWIVGSWKVSGASIKGFDFYSDNMCQVLNNDAQLCYKDKIAIYNNAFLDNKVEQDTTDSRFDIKIILDNDIVEYHFERVDSLNVNWNILDPEDPSVVKSMYRLTR